MYYAHLCLELQPIKVISSVEVSDSSPLQFCNSQGGPHSVNCITVDPVMENVS